jgi:hypothetical protein
MNSNILCIHDWQESEYYELDFETQHAAAHVENEHEYAGTVWVCLRARDLTIWNAKFGEATQSVE